MQVPPKGLTFVFLFGCFAVERFLVSLGIRLRRMYDAIMMIGRRVDRIEFHLLVGCVDDIMPRSCGNDDRKAVPYRVLHTIKNRPPLSCFTSDELVKVMYFFPDVLTRLQAHNDKLTIFGRVEDRAEILVVE